METPNLELLNRFQKSIETVKQLKSLDNDTLLFLYSHYKQADIGNCNTTEPSFWDFTGKAKYTAWKNIFGMSKDIAMEKYIQKVKEISK
jgi:diazepam-binding inhibitor (GABA receptor modulating acyl-CoA-binding protein)